MTDKKELSVFPEDGIVTEIYKSENLPSLPSFGGKTLAENAASVDIALKKMAPLERVWNRRKSEWVWKYGNLSYYDDFGNIKQLAAEISNIRTAIQGAKWGHLKGLAKLELYDEKIEKETSQAKIKLLKLKKAELEDNMANTVRYIEGSFKDVHVLEKMYDSLLEQLGDFNEEDFESQEPFFHLCLAIQQSMRDIRNSGKISKANAEYLEWSGLNISKLEIELQKAITKERELDTFDGTYLRDFVRTLASNLLPIVLKKAKIMGLPPEHNKEALYLTKVAKEDENGI